jgi:hypothetical protein
MRLPIALVILGACATAPQPAPPPVDWAAFRAPDDRPRRSPEECAALIAASPQYFDTASASGPAMLSGMLVTRQPGDFAQKSALSFVVSVEGRADTTSVVFHKRVSEAWKASVRRALSRSLFVPALVDQCPVPRRMEMTYEF